MVALHVVLRQDTLVGDLPFGQKIFGVELMHQGIALVLFIPQHRGFDTSTLLHPHPINEGVKRGEGGVKPSEGVKFPREHRGRFSVFSVKLNLLVFSDVFSFQRTIISLETSFFGEYQHREPSPVHFSSPLGKLHHSIIKQKRCSASEEVKHRVQPL